MRKKRIVLAAFVAALALVAACSRKARLERIQAFLGGTGSLSRQIAYTSTSPVPPAQETVAVTGEPRPPLESLDAARKLIRNAEVSVEVGRFAEASRKAAEIARAFGGYVADSQASWEGERTSGTLVVRVRAESFDPALAALRALGRVRSEHVAVQDVTKAYADLETRLRVKRETARRVTEILRDRTAKLSDVLAAEKELSSLVEQIEAMEGERRWYDHEVALSTISAELHEPESLTRPSAFEPLSEALRNSVAILSRSLAAFLVAALFVLPWGILIGVLASLWRRARRRAGTGPRPWPLPGGEGAGKKAPGAAGVPAP